MVPFNPAAYCPRTSDTVFDNSIHHWCVKCHSPSCWVSLRLWTPKCYYKNLSWTASWETCIHSFHSMSTTSFNVILKPIREPFGFGLLCSDKWLNLTDIMECLDGPIIIVVVVAAAAAAAAAAARYLSRWKLEISWKMYDFYACLMPFPYNPLLRASREPILLTIPSDMNILTLATRTVLWSDLIGQRAMTWCGRKETRSF